MLRPTYRSLFELLSGQAQTIDKPVLEETPLLAESTDGPRFLPARDVLFASTSGIKERSGLSGRLPVFVLEAEPAAEAPLASIFGCRVLERVLDWHPDPGETALDDQEMQEFRSGLRILVPFLLARIRAERSRDSDRVNLIAFADNVEPVSELELSCTLDGEYVDRLSSAATTSVLLAEEFRSRDSSFGTARLGLRHLMRRNVWRWHWRTRWA